MEKENKSKLKKNMRIELPGVVSFKSLSKASNDIFESRGEFPSDKLKSEFLKILKQEFVPSLMSEDSNLEYNSFQKKGVRKTKDSIIDLVDKAIHSKV